MSSKLNLANHEHTTLWIAFADIEEAINNGEYDKAKSLCRVWTDEVRYSNIISDYTLMTE
jgi:hypothetical protein